MAKQRVLSGMQSSGRLHLGNLVGALQNWVRLQRDYDCYYFIADWHSLTTLYTDTSLIRENVKDVLINWLAAGIDPQKCTIFIQSRVLEHAELHLLFSMITPLGWLERVPTYKEKQEEIKDRDLGTYGFLGYPVLQSADILIYRAQYVPVGIDQIPHLEITREIARRFNFLYGNIFPEPEAMLTEFPKLPGIDGRKMSKSYGNAIYLSDPPKDVEQKLLTMMTDPARVKKTDPGEPEICPVFTMHKIFSSKEEQQFCASGCRTAGIGCIECKRILIKNIFGVMEPIWEKRNELLQHPDVLSDIVEEGIKKARKAATVTMTMAREAMRI